MIFYMNLCIFNIKYLYTMYIENYINTFALKLLKMTKFYESYIIFNDFLS